ncbi:MAG: hypothetical protein JWM76_3470 [Pseudonocardiales bacterium]|nr:hypothetical protein [Pseudonocardiales bacterium]
MIVTVCADKGSPGVSTTATVLAMVWPGDRVLLEADPSGGDASLRMRTPDGELLARQPALRGLAVDARSATLPMSLPSYAHQTSLGVPVIPATDMRTDDFALIARQWPAIAAAAHHWTGTVIADLGRLQEGSTAGPVAAMSTIVVLIARATPEGLYHLRERATVLTARLGQGLQGRSPLTVAVLCPAREHEARLRDVRTHLAAEASTSTIPVSGWIADDAPTVRAMRQGQLTRKLARSDLVQSARELVATLLSTWPPSELRQPDVTTSAWGVD